MDDATPPAGEVIEVGAPGSSPGRPAPAAPARPRSGPSWAGLGVVLLAAVLVLQVLVLVGMNRTSGDVADLTGQLQALATDVVANGQAVGAVGADVAGLQTQLDALELSAATITPGETSTAQTPATGAPQTQAATGVITSITGTDYYSGEQLTFSAGEGKARVFMVWAHWCPYCQADLDVLSTWYPANRDRFPNTELVSVSTFMDDSRSNPLVPYLEESQFQFPVLMDETSALAIDLGNTGSVPFWLFVDADGTILGAHSGALSEEGIDDVFTQVEQIAASS